LIIKDIKAENIEIDGCLLSSQTETETESSDDDTKDVDTKILNKNEEQTTQETNNQDNLP